jgi:hypothetical protein
MRSTRQLKRTGAHVPVEVLGRDEPRYYPFLSFPLFGFMSGIRTVSLSNRYDAPIFYLRLCDMKSEVAIDKTNNVWTRHECTLG